jgi:hypothetical protein
MMRAHAWRLACVASVTLLLAHAAGAVTIVSLTGEGELNFTATGAVYFDASGLAATDLTLTASDRVDIGVPFPTGIPDPGSEQLTRLDVSGVTDIVLDGDVYFDLFTFSGGITFLAQSIHVIGPIEATGDVTLLASSIVVTDLGLINAGGSTSGCQGGSGATITSGIGGTSTGCSWNGQIGGGGTVLIPDPNLPGVGLAPVPEPRAALLFFLGMTLVAVRRSF